MPLPIRPGSAVPSQGDASFERIGRYTVPTEVAAGLRRAAAATGVGFEMLATKAAIESSFRPTVTADRGSASGMFQFIEQTWLSMVQRHGANHGLGAEAASIVRQGSRLTVADPGERQRILNLRFDTETSARFAGEYVRELGDSLRGALGRAPDTSELYMAYFLGPRGAATMLRTAAATPNVAAAEILPDAAANNPGVFRTREGEPVTAGAFVQRVKDRVAAAYAAIGQRPPEGAALQAMVDSPRQQRAAPTTLARTTLDAMDGAGAAAPVRVRQDAERALLDVLSRVFTKMDGEYRPGEERSIHRSAEPNLRLPGQVLSALQGGTTS